MKNEVKKDEEKHVTKVTPQPRVIKKVNLDPFTMDPQNHHSITARKLDKNKKEILNL